MEKAKKINTKELITLLKKGYVLTQPGSELNKLWMNKDGIICFEGISDRKPTYLDENNLNFINKSRYWFINL